MKCPKCKNKMKLVAKDFSFNYKVKPNIKYQRSVYWCKDDDIWINIEIPVKK